MLSYLAMPSFGLDISDESVKFAELTLTSSGLRLGRHGEKKIPEGIIEAGKIVNTQKFEELLASLRQGEGLRSVRVSLPEEQIYLFKLRLEKKGLKSIREGIELSLEEHIPVPAPDAIFDYEIIHQGERDMELQVVAIPKNVIENYLAVFKNAGLSVQSFELEAQSIARAIIPRGDMGTYMIVDFGEKRTGIFIISGGITMFTSTLEVGGVMLNNMIMKNFKVSREEAENMKKTYGLERNAGRANPIIRKIILCGGDSNLIGLSEYLAISMKTTVEMANVWVNIMDTKNNIPEINRKHALSFAAALGLALADFEYD